MSFCCTPQLMLSAHLRASVADDQESTSLSSNRVWMHKLGDSLFHRNLLWTWVSGTMPAHPLLLEFLRATSTNRDPVGDFPGLISTMVCPKSLGSESRLSVFERLQLRLRFHLSKLLPRLASGNIGRVQHDCLSLTFQL
jgi:hypothetical protein